MENNNKTQLRLTGLYMRTAEAVRATKNPSRAYALCGVFLRHILARRNASHCFMGGPKRHIQPER
jgi:hypothetical protein